MVCLPMASNSLSCFPWAGRVSASNPRGAPGIAAPGERGTAMGGTAIGGAVGRISSRSPMTSAYAGGRASGD